ncbi:hypothetical protein GCM10027271_15210 [Saccharopolyspora gloriosae]
MTRFRTLRVPLTWEEQQAIRAWREVSAEGSASRFLADVKQVVPRVPGLPRERVNSTTLSSAELTALSAWRRTHSDVLARTPLDSLAVRAIERGGDFVAGGPVEFRAPFTPAHSTPFNGGEKEAAQLESRCIGLLVGAMAADLPGDSYRTALAFVAAESVIRSHLALRRAGAAHLVQEFHFGKQRLDWLLGQRRAQRPSGWLWQDRAMLGIVGGRFLADADRDPTALLAAAAPLAVLGGSEEVVAALQAWTADAGVHLAGAALAALLRHRVFHPTWGVALSAVRTELRPWPDHEPVLALLGSSIELARTAPAGVAARQEIINEHFGSGAAHAALAAALYAVASSASWQDAFDVASGWEPDGRTAGMLCGFLNGMCDGPTAVPGERLRDSRLLGVATRLGRDLAAEFGRLPRDDAEWHRGYPSGPWTTGASPDAPQRTTVIRDEHDRPANPRPQSAARPEPLSPRDRFIGALVGGAVGDALGYAVEFQDIGTIRREHGEGGLAGPVLRDGVARVSDDTQMMLFTLEGLIRAHVARRMKPVDNDPIPEVQHAYQRWLHTQGRPWAQAGGPYAQHLQVPDGWLITNSALFAQRAPGGTCLGALESFERTHRHATPQHRINDSKGCGGVMRAAPVAVWSNDPAEVFWAAVGTAALTHGHPSGFLSAGVHAVIVHQLIREVPLPEAVRVARDLLVRWPRHEEQLRALDAAVELSERGPVAPEEIEAALGQGWVGEEALAIGLYAVLATGGVREALLLSVNHSGDSDSTGMVCGNIAGALHGIHALPPEWLQALELRDVVEALARDALTEFSPSAPTDASWTWRYPAW